MQLREERPAIRCGDLPPTGRFLGFSRCGLLTRNDIYFEDVGGAIWAVLPYLNKFARVQVSGPIAQYNGSPSDGHRDRLAQTLREVLSKSLTVQGFINYDFTDEHYAEVLRVVSAGIAEGRIRYREDVTEGLENAPEEFSRYA